MKELVVARRGLVKDRAAAKNRDQPRRSPRRIRIPAQRLSQIARRAEGDKALAHIRLAYARLPPSKTAFIFADHARCAGHRSRRLFRGERRERA
ncbi:MAG: hypothetical protein ACREDA_02230 [Methylocella sp.]